MFGAGIHREEAVGEAGLEVRRQFVQSGLRGEESHYLLDTSVRWVEAASTQDEGHQGWVERRRHRGRSGISLLHRDRPSCGEVGVGEELFALLPLNQAPGVELPSQVGVDRGYQ